MFGSEQASQSVLVCVHTMSFVDKAIVLLQVEQQ